jgi:NodT family efflux transporter outer membrane factor (OMF) lipoprotein
MPSRKHYRGSCMLLLAAILLTSGCMKVGPDYSRPPVAIEKDWMEAEHRQVKTDAGEYRSWWRAFDDPILDRLIETAYRENLTLRIAGIRVLEARAQLGVAIGEWYPQKQQATGSLQRVRLSDRAPQSITNPQLAFSQAEIGLTASWELDFWGKFRRAIESADAGFLAAIADYDTTLVSLTADVASSYVLIRTLEKRLSIARQNVETQKESLQIAEARLQGGTTTQRDVDQAKTLLYNTQAAVPALEAQLRQAKNALSVLLGMPPAQLTDLLGGAADIPAPPPQVAVGIPADLLRRRPDIRTAELRAAAQCAQIGVAKADLLPAFSLTGTFGVQSSTFGRFELADMFRYGARNLSGGPTFQWNLLNYGQITNRVRVQDARFQELLIAYQNAVLKAQQEVEDALVAFLRAQERAGFLAESTASAQSSLNLAVLQYREGVTDFTTVLTAQQALLNEQDNLANTLGDIARNLVGIYRALGGGWEMREGHDFVPEEIQAEMAKRTNWGGLLQPASHTLPELEKPEAAVRPPDW